MTEPSGLLRVTTSVAFGQRWRTPRLSGFRAAYPRVQIELILSDTPVAIAAEGIDVALRLSAGMQGGVHPIGYAGGFHCRKAFRCEVSRGGVARLSGHPAHPTDLSEHEGLHFALPRFGTKWRFRTTPNAPELEVRPRAALSISSALALRRAALEGLGVTLLADWTIANELKAGHLVDLFPETEASAAEFDTAVWSVYANLAHVPFRQRVFLDHLWRPAGV